MNDTLLALTARKIYWAISDNSNEIPAWIMENKIEPLLREFAIKAVTLAIKEAPNER